MNTASTNPSSRGPNIILSHNLALRQISDEVKLGLRGAIEKEMNGIFKGFKKECAVKLESSFQMVPQHCSKNVRDRERGFPRWP